MVTSRVWTTKVEEMLVPVSSRRSLENASPGVFNQDHWVVTVRSYRGLCLCHANRAHGSMCTVLKRNPGKPPGKCPNCARSDLKLFFSEKINLPGFRFQNITCRFFCVCVCLHGHCSFAKAFHMQTFIHDEKPGRSPNHWDERWTSHKEWLVYLGVCQGDLHRTHNSTTSPGTL